MDSIEQDFRFNPLSLAYGQFITEVHTMDSHALLVDVTRSYTRSFRGIGDVVICVTTTEDVAMLLKLRFGSELVKRPPREPDMYSMKILKNRGYGNKNIYWDYESSFDTSYMKQLQDGILSSFMTNKELSEEFNYAIFSDLDK